MKHDLNVTVGLKPKITNYPDDPAEREKLLKSLSAHHRKLLVINLVFDALIALTIVTALLFLLE